MAGRARGTAKRSKYFLYFLASLMLTFNPSFFTDDVLLQYLMSYQHMAWLSVILLIWTIMEAIQINISAGLIAIFYNRYTRGSPSNFLGHARQRIHIIADRANQAGKLAKKLGGDMTTSITFSLIVMNAIIYLSANTGSLAFLLNFMFLCFTLSLIFDLILLFECNLVIKQVKLDLIRLHDSGN